MKILLVSGGKNENGATARVMKEAENVILNGGGEAISFHLSSAPISPCNGCGACRSLGECVINDRAKDLISAARECDGYIFFTPVHYGGASGGLKAAMGRLFYSSKEFLKFKPGAAVAVARRGGNVSATEEINKFFYFMNMPIISGNYPGVVYGKSYADVERDAEGLQTVRSIAENMIWLLKCISAGENAGVRRPEGEKKIMTDR